MSADPRRVQWTGPNMKLAEEEMTYGLETNGNAPDKSWAASDCREVSIKDRGNEQAAVNAISIGELPRKRFCARDAPTTDWRAVQRPERPA